MKTNSLRTLFITREVPYPPRGGASLRNWQNINIINQYGPVAVFSASNWTPDYTSIPGVQVWQHQNVATQRQPLEKVARRLWWLRPLADPDTDWSYSHTAAENLDQLIKTFAPNLVICKELWVYRYLKTIKRHSCPIIFDDYNVESVLFSQNHHSPPNLKARLKATIQLGRIQAIERDFIRQCQQVWACSAEDAQLLQQLYPHPVPIHVIPNSIDVDYYHGVSSGQISPPPELNHHSQTIVFIGQLSYPPNTVAGELLVTEIYPRLRQQYPQCRLIIVGRNPSPTMLAAAAQNPGITITGSVPDVRPYLAAASIILVPLLQGSGTRLKILEAFAANRPVVSTAKGAEGINAIDGEHLLIGNTIDELVAGVTQLWSNPELAAKLAANAYQLVQAEYSWAAVQQRVETAILPLLDGRID
ncbi:MAG TPA: glycosyltransferase [Oscillatoriaceae cyanobacterium M33_DOE_052]|uniref:Glycosyltransferase n=1 Tax=Planktothricoides sp. SpSt-374 TaxID=2282167 RepID=A0A7C3VLF8_9CYAN|nr:glycosyltransferase [Oscillatoriaceae cyanobacterium M33_DOE_052]